MRAEIDFWHLRADKWLLAHALVVSAAWHLAVVAVLVLVAAVLLRFAEGLSWRGVIVGLAFYVAIAALILGSLHRHDRHKSFGSANVLTLLRAATTSLFFGILSDFGLIRTLASNTELRWILTVLGAVAFLLDGFDGRVARRRGMATDFGARFDMEADALLMVALALLVYSSGQTGAWVIVSGLLRYLFVIGGHFWTTLAAPLLPSGRRKIIYFVQMAILIVVLAPVIAPELGWMLCAVGLSLLGCSFGADCLRLATRARDRLK